jgi:hypothetical protein
MDRRSWDRDPTTLQATPAAGPVVGDYCLEELQQSTLLDWFVFVYLNRSCGRIALPLVHYTLGVSFDRIISAAQRVNK